VPGDAIHQDDAVLAGEHAPQAIGGHHATNAATKDNYALACHIRFTPA
jgi:hypothetical protein